MDEQHHSTATSTTTTTTTPPPTIAVQTDDVDPTVAVATRSGLNVSIDDDHDDELVVQRRITTLTTRSKSPPPRPSSRQLTDVISQVAEELKCPICLDHFRDAIYLPCHHTFCLQCVRSMVVGDHPKELKTEQDEDSQSSAVLTCPMCRVDCCVPSGGVDAFPPNFQIRNLVQKIEPLGTFKKCGRCRKRTASIYCFTCEVFMCDNCDEDEPAHQAHEAARTTTTTTSITTTTHTDSHSDAASAVESVVPRASTVVSRSSSSSSLSALGTNGHVRVPLLDAIAILQMRKADALLDTGTLGALYVKPVLSDAAARKAALASQRSWLSRSSGRLDDRRVLRSSLIIVPNWCWKCETLSSGSTLGVGASSCQLRAWRRPILVSGTTTIDSTLLRRLAPFDISRALRLEDQAPAHPTARLARADVNQQETWAACETVVRGEAVRELEIELTRRHTAHRRTAIVPRFATSDVSVVSKTVRRVWVPIYEVVLSSPTGPLTLHVNAQSGRVVSSDGAPTTTPSILSSLGFGLAAMLSPLVAYQYLKK